ncbi:hypothetical protein P153DRAFT_288711 [Dothidotthia symphoricarpi CBS 119687]|uniref:Uncharacterized protein n=1 Tax=Dothidotthia symphoricarpi CBS 119687 TaxID=1392245 RepID=A0A6A6AJC4_9PLEO|nr:uncharacterized protein P153DRAFT_288711 [Dothidotthia symphoricarpi CBS 119687]KAF2130541.1 hypothetical protein P153DRAFT_288711 [Dothidotthia symphoricarpi CBS 119687]
MTVNNGTEKDGIPSITSLSFLDLVIDAATKFIAQERRRNFSFLARYSHKYTDTKDLLVVTCANSDDVKALHSHMNCSSVPDVHDHQWYTFSEPLCSNGFRRTVAIDIVPGEPSVAANMFVSDLRRDGRMTMLDAWIRESYEWHDVYEMRFRELQQNEQQLWWESTGQTFRLLDLPLELREAVYLQVIGSVVLPDIDPSSTQPTTLGAGCSYGSKFRTGSELDPDVHVPNLTITRVNKQVKEEVMQVAHRDTFKRFRAVGEKGYSRAQPSRRSSFHTNLTGIQSLAPHVAFLRNVQLEMSAACYFSFVGIIPTRGDPFGLDASSPAQYSHVHMVQASVLTTFKALQKLDLRFISPKHQEAACPWHIISLCSSQANTYATHSCQKVWIDWFLTFAWDYLKALRGVKFSLSGCVKDSTRTHWERVLNDLRNDWTSDIKDLELQIKQNKTDCIPIPCDCSVSCSTSNYPPSWTQHELERIEGLKEEVNEIYWSFKD